jgi:hypothetical protein
MFFLPCPACPVLPAMFCLTCSAWPVLLVPFCLSHSVCTVLPTARQKPVSAAAKNLGSMTLLSRQVFSAQGSPRKKLKICPELPGKSFLNIYINILYGDY